MSPDEQHKPSWQLVAEAYNARVAAYVPTPYRPVPARIAERKAREAAEQLGEPPAWVAEPSGPIRPRQKPRVQIPERRDDF
jgi:hypothetical protein